jgi:hypothetical protein
MVTGGQDDTIPIALRSILLVEAEELQHLFIGRRATVLV